MKQSGQAVLLRIYISESDRCNGKPLYELIVLRARELGIAGATVLRGIMGYGVDRHMHTAKLLRLAEDLPITIELLDSEANIAKLLPFLDEAVQEGLITLEKLQVITYRQPKSQDQAQAAQGK